MLRFVIPVMLIAILSSLTAIKLRKRFGTVCPFVIMSMALAVYTSGVLFGSFLPGYLIIGASPFLLVGLIIKDRGLSFASFTHALRSYCATGGATAYFAFAGLCMVIAHMHGSDPVYWDEFAHWGQMAKELFRLDAFYTIDQTTLLYHNDYPPIIPLWEAICCKIAGKWSGQIMYASLWMLQLSIFLPFIEKASKNLGKSILDASSIVTCVLLFTLVLTPCFDGGQASFWLSIYIDTILGLLFGFGLYLAVREEKSKFDWIGIGITLCFLVLVKQSSLFFIGCIFAVLATTIVSISPRERRIKDLLSLGIAIAACGIFLFSWKYVLSTSTLDAVHGQFSVPISALATLPSILMGADPTYRPEVVSRFLEALAYRPIASYLPVPVTYMGATALLVLVTSLCCIWRKASRSQSLCLIGSQVLTAILYAAFMLIMYMFSFSELDALSLVCYERYMSTVLVGLYAAAFMICIQHATSSDRHSEVAKHSSSTFRSYRNVSMFILALCLILMISPEAMKQIRVEKNASAKEFSKDGDLLEERLPEGSSVFIINQGRNPFETLEIAYYADGIKVSREVEAYYSVESLSWEVPTEKLVELIGDEDYIYINNIDQKFIDTYQSAFSLTMESGEIYSIDEVRDTKIFLSLVA